MRRPFRLHRRGRVWHVHGYIGGERVERSTHCEDRKAAEAVARQIERDLADPADATSNAATLSDALNLLLRTREEQAKAGRKSAATVAFYRQKSGHLLRVLEHDGDVGAPRVPFRLARLQARDVDRFISARRGEGASEGTIAKEIVTLRAALKLARRHDLWQGDPGAVCPIAFSPEYEPRTRFLSRPELQKLLAELEEDRAARVGFIVATSACWKETVLARREDVTEGLSAVLIRGTKRKTRFRTVPIVSGEQKSLLRYAVEHAQGGGGLFFTTWHNAGRDLDAACERAGIPRCTPNDLRRTCATWLRARGTPPHLLAPIMGHADSRMVEKVYGRLSPADLAVRIAAAIGVEVPEDFRTCSTESVESVEVGGLGGLVSGGKPNDLAPAAGLEPATSGLTVRCSTN